MTGNIFIDCVFLFLICYALINLFYKLSDFLMKKYAKYPDSSFLVLEIIHESKSLENDLRCAISKSLSQKCALVVICTDLSTEEYTLVWRLTDMYKHIVLTTRDELTNKVWVARNISVSQ